MKAEKKKKWFRNPSLWLSVAAIVVAALALWLSCRANDISEKANEIAAEANRISEASTKPTLVVESFLSSSIDINNAEDLQKITRDKVILELSKDASQSENKQQYAWLLIRNKGAGLAKIFTVTIPYSLNADSKIRTYTCEEGKVISPGEVLAIYLGYFLEELQFWGEVEVTYKTVLDETDPIHISINPESVSWYEKDVAVIDVTVTATPEYP